MKSNMKKAIEFFEGRPLGEVWSPDRIVAILMTLAGPTKILSKILSKSDQGWAEDMYKSFIHERPFPLTQPPTDRVFSKSEQKRRTIQEGSRKKGGINSVSVNPKPKVKPAPQKPMRPDGHFVYDGQDAAKVCHHVVKMYWTETEAGWGQRPDGYSLHLTREDSETYVKDYWNKMPDRGPNGEVPYEYSRPGDPMVTEVDAKTLREIKKSKNGIRRYDQ